MFMPHLCFRCDLNLKIAWKCRSLRPTAGVFACNSHVFLSLFVYFEDGKWVTCLDYPFSGFHASGPRNGSAWETFWLKTSTGASERWPLSKGAHSGTDAAMSQPGSHAPVPALASRYTHQQNQPELMMLFALKQGTLIFTHAT